MFGQSHWAMYKYRIPDEKSEMAFWILIWALLTIYFWWFEDMRMVLGRFLDPTESGKRGRWNSGWRDFLIKSKEHESSPEQIQSIKNTILKAGHAGHLDNLSSAWAVQPCACMHAWARFLFLVLCNYCGQMLCLANIVWVLILVYYCHCPLSSGIFLVLFVYTVKKQKYCMES